MFAARLLTALSLLICGVAQATAAQTPVFEFRPEAVRSIIHNTFATVQVASQAHERPVVSCNFMTGVATGVGAGTCVSVLPTCNGVANDQPSFEAFRTWGKDVWQASHTGLIRLYIPPGLHCVLGAGANRPVDGLRKILVEGYGSIFDCPLGCFLGGQGQPNGQMPRLYTANAGDTCVTFKVAGETSIFTVGQWALITGFDLYGGGRPSGPHWFEYVKPASIDAGKGIICFEAALKYTYLDTWPDYSDGTSIGGVDPGGPTTLYTLDPSWDIEVEWRGLQLLYSHQLVANGRKATFRDIDAPGDFCLLPSVNLLWQAINVTATNCFMEFDKLNTEVVFDNSTIHLLEIQVSSSDILTITRSNFVAFNGTPKVTNISDSTLGTGAGMFRPGAFGAGRSDELTCTNCVIENPFIGGLAEKAPFDFGVNVTYGMVGGVIMVPVVNGPVRWAVPGTNLFWSGQHSTSQPNGSAFQVVSVTKDTWPPPDLQTLTRTTTVAAASRNLSTSTDTFVPGDRLKSINVPGAGAAGGLLATVILTVTDARNVVLQSPASTSLSAASTALQFGTYNTNVVTTLSGGFPTVPLDSGKLYIRTHPSPTFTCTNCSGSVEALSWSRAPARIPQYSYSQVPYTNSSTIPMTAEQWGVTTRVTIDVTSAYAGATDPLKINITGAGSIPGSATVAFLDSFTNVRQLGQRVITPAGVTCNGAPGGCAGDTGMTLPDPAFWWSGLGGGFLPTSFSGSLSVTVTVETNQGVVPTTLPYLLKRDLDPAANDNTPAFLNKAA